MRDLSDFLKDSWDFFTLVSLFVGYFLTERAKFRYLEGPKGLQDKPPCPVGSHYSFPATSPIISFAFALWKNV